MKRDFIRLIQVIILILSISILVNTNVKAENKISYITMLKENSTVEDDVEITKEQEIVEVNNEVIKEETKIEEKSNIVKKQETKKVDTTKNKDESSNDKSNQENTSKQTDNIKYGTFGRLYIPGYNAALYDFNVNTTSEDSLQTIVNNIDSAAYYMNYGKLVIADHNYQGFSALVNLSEGSTSTIKFEDGSEIKYKMIKKATGVNNGPDLIDNEGNSFFAMDFDIIMYTCYDGGIMATLWVLL